MIKTEMYDKKKGSAHERGESKAKEMLESLRKLKSKNKKKKKKSH